MHPILEESWTEHLEHRNHGDSKSRILEGGIDQDDLSAEIHVVDTARCRAAGFGVIKRHVHSELDAIVNRVRAVNHRDVNERRAIPAPVPDADSNVAAAFRARRCIVEPDAKLSKLGCRNGTRASGAATGFRRHLRILRSSLSLSLRRRGMRQATEDKGERRNQQASHECFATESWLWSSWSSSSWLA